MSNVTQVRPAGAGSSGPTFRRAGPVLVAGIAIAVAVAALDGMLAGPRHVERVTFENTTAYDLAVAVSGEDRDGWLPLGVVRREASTSMRHVVDQGDVWTFRFAAQGEDGGEVRVTRDELAESNWTFTIPADVGGTLQAAGAAPQP